MTLKCVKDGTMVKKISSILMIICFVVCTSVLYAEDTDKRGLNWQKIDSTHSELSFLKGNYRAVIIGNDQYLDEVGVWNPLKTATRDAEAVSELLREMYGFEDITLLKDATRKEILVALNDLAKRVEPNDSVMIYYAGHGHLNEETKRGYWIPVDARGEDYTTYIRNSTIRDEINIIAEKTKHTLLISDSCFSGSLLRGGNRAAKKSEKTSPYYAKVSNKKSVQILAAGGVEFVDDNYRGSGHSPFTYFLLNELRNNVDALLTMTELSNNVVKAVANNVDQTPESGILQGAGDELGEFIFARINLKDNSVEIFASKTDRKTNEVTIINTTQTTPEVEPHEIFIPLPRF